MTVPVALPKGLTGGTHCVDGGSASCFGGCLVTPRTDWSIFMRPHGALRVMGQKSVVR